MADFKFSPFRTTRILQSLIKWLGCRCFQGAWFIHFFILLTTPSGSSAGLLPEIIG